MADVGAIAEVLRNCPTAWRSFTLAFLLAFLALTSIQSRQSARASFGNPQNQAVYKLPTVFRDEFIRVVADTKIDESDGQSVADFVKEAIDFDLKTLAWKKDELLGKGFCVAILSEDYIKNKLHTDFGGEALELDLFAIKLETYRRDKVRSSIVIAHELFHNFVLRRFNGLNPRLQGWSRPLDEGLAQIIESRFALSKYKNLYPSDVRFRPAHMIIMHQARNPGKAREMLLGENAFLLSPNTP